MGNLVSSSPILSNMLSPLLLFLFHGFRHMFYLIHPLEIALGPDDPYPDIFLKYGLPMFFVFIAAEWLFISARRKITGDGTQKSPRLKEVISSTAIGAAQLLFTISLELCGMKVD